MMLAAIVLLFPTVILIVGLAVLVRSSQFSKEIGDDD